MRNTIIIIFISSVLFILGCSGKEEFTNVFIEESSDGTLYKCVFKQKEINDMETEYSFVLTKEPDPKNHSLHMEGKVWSMALCEDSNLLVIAFSPLEGPNPAGYKYFSDDYELIFVNTDTLKESHRWRIEPKKEFSKPVESLHNFDDIVLSDDGTKVVTNYCRDSKQFIIIWDSKTGEFIQEFKLSPDNPALRGVIHGFGITDMIISQDNKFVACAGAWSVRSVKGKGSHDIEPGSFLYVWRIKDSKCFELRFEKTYYLRKLCFDAANKYIACHNGTTIMVFRIDDGKLIHSQNVNDSILKINWNKSKKAFQIKIKQQSDMFIAPSEL